MNITGRPGGRGVVAAIAGVALIVGAGLWCRTSDRDNRGVDDSKRAEERVRRLRQRQLAESVRRRQREESAHGGWGVPEGD